MTVARSVADVLTDHVTLEIESIDRMYCNLYVPQLGHVNGVVLPRAPGDAVGIVGVDGPDQQKAAKAGIGFAA